MNENVKIALFNVALLLGEFLVAYLIEDPNQHMSGVIYFFIPVIHVFILIVASIVAFSRE